MLDSLKIKQIIILAGLLPFILLTCATNINPSNDDGWFRTNTQQYSLVGWIDMRYQTWSGRVTAEALTHTFLQRPVDVWRAMNIVMYLVLVVCIYKYYTLLVAKRSEGRDLAVLALCTVVPLVMGVMALLGSAFWVTGSIFYLWIAALGLIAFYPILYTYVRRTLPPKWLMTIGIGASAMAALGQEQVSALLVGFTGLAVAGLFWQTRRIWLYPVFQLVITVLAAGISYFAPGNMIRMESEIRTWLPTFQTAPLMDRFEWSLRWFMDATINHFGFVFILMWGLIALLMLAKARQVTLGWRDQAIVMVLVAAVFLHLASPLSQYVLDFHAQWGVAEFPTMSYTVLAFWLAVLAVTVIGLYRVSALYLQRRFALPLMGLGILLATAIITLSPTMYASEQRTLFVPGILGILILVVLAGYAFREYWAHRLLLFTVFFLAFAINVVALLAYRFPSLQTLLG